MSEKCIPDSDVPNLHNLNAGLSMRSVVYWVNEYYNIIPILCNYLTEIKLLLKEKALLYFIFACVLYYYMFIIKLITKFPCSR